jgi:hypothetical protein
MVRLSAKKTSLAKKSLPAGEWCGAADGAGEFCKWLKPWSGHAAADCRRGGDCGYAHHAL